MSIRTITLFLSFLLPQVIIAQKQSPLDIALHYLNNNRQTWNLTASDLADVRVSDQYQSRHNGVNHIYLLQYHAGIPVLNGMAGVHITKDGRVAHATINFISGLSEKINSSTPTVSAQSAIRAAARHLELEIDAPLQIIDAQDKTEITFEGAGIARQPIRARLVYQPLPDSRVRLAWDLAIDQINRADYWSLRFDATTGALLAQNSYTVHCRLEDMASHRHGAACFNTQGLSRLRSQQLRPAPIQARTLAASPGESAAYRVFPLPVESPAHGDRKLVINPADELASPFGWHDTDGEPGPEHTITRGNNVHAFLDPNDTDVSNDDEPEGGRSLTFDFPFDPSLEPEEYQDAAVTQLFYMNNIMHDLAYHYGFDEAAGNFQQNNYGKSGEEGDPIKANAQDGGDFNNANFTSPSDGESGRMQMYLWNQDRNQLFAITAPDPIAGSIEAATANFGPAIDTIPVSGRVVEAFDGSNAPSMACNAITNPGEITGNIALVDRGECFFEQKVANAEEAGAIAVIVCNFEDGLTTMGGVADVDDPGIPSVMLKSSDCQRIRDFMNLGVEVRLQRQTLEGPERLDGDFDNGVVAHEYAHGISIRLTGGGKTASCLFNDEQMGEGWSDFFTLATTYQPGATGEIPRGIGNYVLRAGLNSGGVRRQPYSTDLSVNTQTFDDIIGTSSPHQLGEIWTSMLWDMYWKFIERYGWDDDLYTGSGGNNMAIQLVIDGMKLQACQPGFAEARDAIIKADSINNNGANTCLLWEVFSRRGLGWSAEQGSSFNRNDGVRAFDMRPECVQELKIAKTATELINPGEPITYTLTITNHKGAGVSGVTLTDQLPEGASFIGGSSVAPSLPRVSGNQVTFDIGDLADGESVTLTYQASTSPDLRSVRQFFDDVENGLDLWFFDNLEGFNIWEITDQNARSGNRSWFVPNTTEENDQVLFPITPIPVTGEQPVLRFYHYYDTEPGTDGGIVEISTDAGQSWQTVEREKIFKNSYRGKLTYQTFSLPFVEGYWGDSESFLDSYIDLSEYKGEDILFRFRFGSQPNSALDTIPETGWFVDDIEIMDMFNYQSEACVSSDQGDFACAEAPSRGTIVESGVFTSVDEPLTEKMQLQVYPNPAQEWLNVAIRSPQSADAILGLLSMDGRLLRQQRTRLVNGEQTLLVKTGDLPPGIYLLRVRTQGETMVEKVVVD